MQEKGHREILTIFALEVQMVFGLKLFIMLKRSNFIENLLINHELCQFKAILQAKSRNVSHPKRPKINFYKRRNNELRFPFIFC